MKRAVLIGGAIILVVAISIAAYLFGKHSTNTVTTKDSTQYPLLAKRLFVDNPNDSFVNFVTLRQQLNSYFTDNNINGSLYFEYLPTGTSIRIAGDQLQVGASLLKVPAAMELYKAAELGKINLDDTVTIQQDWLDSAYGDLYKKVLVINLHYAKPPKLCLSILIIQP